MCPINRGNSNYDFFSMKFCSVFFVLQVCGTISASNVISELSLKLPTEFANIDCNLCKRAYM